MLMHADHGNAAASRLEDLSPQPCMFMLLSSCLSSTPQHTEKRSAFQMRVSLKEWVVNKAVYEEGMKMWRSRRASVECGYCW